MPENESSLADLMKYMAKVDDVKMSLHTVSNTANQAASNMNSISSHHLTHHLTTSPPFATTTTVQWNPPGPPLCFPSEKPGMWWIGGREISSMTLLALVEDFCKKQERIANPPKFDTPEAAQEWLDAVS